MKELSTEEKAKAYDEALEKFDVILNLNIVKESGTISADDVRKIFPELKESEDERIRKALMQNLKERFRTKGNMGKGLDMPDVLAWLEKQAQKPAEWHREDEQNLNACLGYIPDEYLRRWLMDVIHVKYDKPIDKDEPKFKVGDRIVNNISGNICQVTEIRNNEYCLWPLDAEIMGYLRIIDVDNDYHLYTIQDAKDGDVLVASDGSIFLFAGVVDLACKYYVALTTDDVIKFNEGLEHYWETSRTAHPATKEQRDILEKAMADAGYKWNADEKKLEKIEQKSDENEELTEFDKAVGVSIGTWNPKTPEQIQSVKAVSKKLLKLAKKQIHDEQKPADIPEDFEKLVEHLLSLSDSEGHGSPAKVKEVSTELLRLANQQKTAWSEEDKEMLEKVIKALSAYGDKLQYEGFCHNKTIIQEYIDWLESLKDRVQPKQEWSEEDELYIKELESLVKRIWAIGEHENDKDTIHKMSDLSFFLKTLKPQLKQEWSEEDERTRRSLILELERLGANTRTDSTSPNYSFRVEINWLKSLRPQNRWKPSEEMLRALYRAIPENTMAISEDEILLDKLYQGLKYGRVLSNK